LLLGITNPRQHTPRRERTRQAAIIKDHANAADSLVEALAFAQKAAPLDHCRAAGKTKHGQGRIPQGTRYE
jgi:hypothetical protein